ncbi:MAG TPA: radical SAM protein [Bacteroidales bacterium]|nr:radical SAM protein [Bacteroidales bacterium]
MKLLLTHGYFLQQDPAETAVMKPYPPLGLLYLSAWLSREGIVHSIFDPTFGTMEELRDHLLAERPDLIGIYATLMTRKNILNLIGFVRDRPELRNSRIILGGPDVRFNAEQWLDAGADVAVPGEGEATLTDLIRHFESPLKNDLSGIKGIIFRDRDSRTIITPEEKPLDPDSIPMPAYDRIRVDRYRDAWMNRHGYFSLAVNSMRGCPYSCNWCSKPVYGDSCRRKDPALVAEEIRILQSRYAPDQIWFTDDVFTLRREWLRKFLEELSKRNMHIRYECISRTDCLDDEIILLLKRSGCKKIWIGAESGSQKVLDLMNRRISISQTINVMGRLREAGILTGTFIMAGYPGEHKRDIMLTAQYLAKARPDEFTITLAYPIKGTRYFRDAEPSFLAPYDWSRQSEREIPVRRPYGRRFYYFALRYLNNHAESAKTSQFLRKAVFSLKAFIARIFVIFLS